MARHLKNKSGYIRAFRFAHRPKWKVITFLLSVCVAVGTTAALMLPAITLSEPPCELFEHTHSQEAGCYSTAVESSLVCDYEQLGVHQHTSDCYDKELNPICGYSDKLIHIHGSYCFDMNGALVCLLPQIEEHQHSDSCYSVAQTVVDSGHTHEDSCWEWLVVTEPICGIEESDGHQHDETCVDAEGNLICDVEESDGHRHDNCYETVKGELICTEDEHEAVVETIKQELICGREEIILHQHTDEDCYEIIEVNPDEVGEADIIVGGDDGRLWKKVLICALPAVEQHQHTDSCFVTQEENVLTCELPEHTHSSDCELFEDEYGTERVLEFVADTYVTTIVAPGAANLPRDTTVVAHTVYDSDAPAVVSLFDNNKSEEYYSACVQEIVSSIDWGDVTGIKLFDITLTTSDGEVQPAVPVEITTRFAEPLYIDDGDVIYGVHFGHNGLELLPTHTERDYNGNILSVTHTQSSFSTTGYVLIHTPNPMDIGPDILPVHYCIWVNDQWIIAGSSRTGWYGDYHPRDEWPPEDDQRDYITLDQMGYILAEYGLNITDHEQVKKTIWYQRAEDDGKIIRHDTEPEQREINGEMTWIFPLSGNKVKDDGYHIYFVPNGTTSGSESSSESTYDSNRLLGADLKQESKFYTMTVRDMNQIVYGSDEVLPETQILLYNTPVEVTVKQNKNNGWQWVNDKGQVVHGIDGIYDANGDGLFDQDEYDSRFRYRDNGDGTETYFFGSAESGTGILGRTTLIPYSTAADGAEQSTEKQVDIVVHLDGEWQKVGQLNLMYKQDDVCMKDGQPLWYITAGQVYTILKDFGFTDPVGENDITKDGYTFCHAIGAFDENTDPAQVSLLADGVTQKLIHAASGSETDPNDESSVTIAIGLGTDEEDHFTLFYLPGSSNESQIDIQGKTAKEYAESEPLIEGDRFYSLQVVDDYQLVYYGYEVDCFKVYVQEGTLTEEDNISVEVQNAEGVLWSIRETWADHENYVPAEYRYEQGTNSDIYFFTSMHGPIVIDASSLNPRFTVQYYANIERYVLSDTDTGGLPLIDTANGVLPTNSPTLPLKYLTLEWIGENTDQNAGTQTQLHQVKTYVDNAEIYDQREFEYETAHTWRNIDKLWDNDGYLIDDIWILKEGADPFSTDTEDWWIYKAAENGANIRFTNMADEENIPKNPDQNEYEIDPNHDYTILITEGMIIRLHYKLIDETPFVDNSVSFYDYDVSSDGNSRVTQGINSVHNGYAGNSDYSGYAFGNSNAGTQTKDFLWNGNALNISNGSNYGNVYRGCTFGLVSSIQADTGAVTWGSGIVAPHIFGSAGETGKENYTGSLTFYRKGDVYTLQSSSAEDFSRDDLQYLFNPSPSGVTTHSHIFTNNFWAMDGVTNKDGHGGGSGGTSWLPGSDDGQNHNSYFGMSFAVEFHISDYIGPMEYIFFGDDDMWVFLDYDADGDGTFEKSELICDIGGVHSAVGEYVDLRDYLPTRDVENGNALIDYSDDTYRLRFYYTERGASGSTCWMSFTLPSVTSTVLEEGTSSIVLTKTLTDLSGNVLTSDEEYEFNVDLFTDSSKETPVNTPFSIKITKNSGTDEEKIEFFTTTSGKSFRMGAGDVAEIRGVPIGTYYVIEETHDDRFFVEANGEEGWVIQGTTIEGSNTGSFTNIKKSAVLPETGGTGTFPYILSGWAMIVVASVLIYKTKRRKWKEDEMM